MSTKSKTFSVSDPSYNTSTNTWTISHGDLGYHPGEIHSIHQIAVDNLAAGDRFKISIGMKGSIELKEHVVNQTSRDTILIEGPRVERISVAFTVLDGGTTNPIFVINSRMRGI